MIPEYALNAEDVRGMMLDRMEAHLSLKTEGYRSSTGQTFNLLLKAVCADSCGAVASNMLREQLNTALAVSELRKVKVLTNSRNPALRFFLLGLGLLMENVWVPTRWLFTCRPCKGRHKLIPSLLRFDRFSKLLVRAVER